MVAWTIETAKTLGIPRGPLSPTYKLRGSRRTSAATRQFKLTYGDRFGVPFASFDCQSWAVWKTWSTLTSFSSKR
jgi:hypothetical protein